MAKIVLVTGGSRSGKSSYAQRLAEAMPGRRAFIATCPVVDEEMRERIEKHRAARRPGDWATIEEPVDLARVIGTCEAYDTLLVDCLTLWINNLLYEAEQGGTSLTQEDIRLYGQELLGVCRRGRATVIFVTNEIGMGIVPDNAISRRYRDLVGQCNQTIAAGADRVILVCSGIPLQLKGDTP